MGLLLRELRQRLMIGREPLTRSLERALRADARKGARELLEALLRRRDLEQAERRKLTRLMTYERSLWREGHHGVVGVDEVGRGPLAGPVVAAAVILPPGSRVAGLDDSKRLSATQREPLVPIIRAAAVAWHIAEVDHEAIDAMNIHAASLHCMASAVRGLGTLATYVLVDGRDLLPGIEAPQKPIVDGDRVSASIAAASILAKVARDARMCEIDKQFPGYGFTEHKGYPTRRHDEALKLLGPCPVHRRTFAPVVAAAR